jgi:hypothetical protein
VKARRKNYIIKILHSGCSPTSASAEEGTPSAFRAGEDISRIRDLIKEAPSRKDSFDINTAIRGVIGLATWQSDPERKGVECRQERQRQDSCRDHPGPSWLAADSTVAVSPSWPDRQVMLNLINQDHAVSRMNASERQRAMWRRPQGCYDSRHPHACYFRRED